MVFEARVVLHFLRNSLSSEEPDTLDFELRLLSEDDVSGKGVLSEVVNSLEESISKVSELIEDFSLTFVLIVVQEEDAESLSVVLLQEFSHSFSSSVLHVHEIGLEVIQVEGGRWESIEGVDILLLLLLWLFLLFCLLGFLLLDGSRFSLAVWEGFSTESEVSESSLHFWELSDSLEPSREVGHSLSVSSVQVKLAGN